MKELLAKMWRQDAATGAEYMSLVGLSMDEVRQLAAWVGLRQRQEFDGPNAQRRLEFARWLYQHERISG